MGHGGVLPESGSCGLCNPRPTSGLPRVRHNTKQLSRVAQAELPREHLICDSEAVQGAQQGQWRADPPACTPAAPQTHLQTAAAMSSGGPAPQLVACSAMASRDALASPFMRSTSVSTAQKGRQ
ncbi:hypothetical protein NDU88_005431 [Pleurodeles waltl]|uniref:Uncharacterized protein n=1 Tax=Pleurodeles waltl TaxID=8319 RepID=A0AAV7NMH2_PLEWA|nr:hypothetical protein NDU88_005431 [Pleurodeles waltl]